MSSRMHTAFLIERLLDRDTGVNEEVFSTIFAISDSMVPCTARTYIKKMIIEADATDDQFYLKEDFPFLFGKSFHKGQSY